MARQMKIPSEFKNEFPCKICEYYDKLNKHEIVKCICCGKDIKLLDNDPQLNPIKNMWKQGMVGGISANYGSKHDADVFFIAICDVCITKKKEDGSLIYRYNYIFDKGDNYGISD